ncbi:MAG TPA: sensor histidine kinase [Pseudonocardiaceae bacterium]
MRATVWRYVIGRWSVNGTSGWERRLDVAAVVLPYVLLAVSAVASVAAPDQTWGHRWGTLGLVAVALLWVLRLHTMRPATRMGEGRLSVVYLAGLLVIASVGMARDPVFFVFTITAFVHSAMLQPTPMAFLAVGATSVLINTLPYRVAHPTPMQIVSWFAVIVVQTVLLGSTNLLGRKLTEQSEQRRRTVLELEAALAENAGLHAQLVAQAREAGVHDERQRMAREIHDTLAQGLTGIIAQLEAADQARAVPGAWHRHLDAARALARESLAEARRSVQALHPVQLELTPLPDAVETMARRWSQCSGVPVEFHATGEPRLLVPDVEAALFRAAQEALANVGKHAAASRVGVTLSYTDDVVLLDVRDDGVGFDPGRLRPTGRSSSRNGTGFGLGGMRQRLLRVAGTLDIESVLGEGTAVCAIVPAVTSAEAAS